MCAVDDCEPWLVKRDSKPDPVPTGVAELAKAMLQQAVA